MNNINKNNRIITQIMEILETSIGNKEITLDNDFRFVRNYNLASIKKKATNITEPIKLHNDKIVYNNKFRIYFSKIKPNTNAKYIKLCYNDIELPFSVRPWKYGDEIKMQFGTKKLSRLFIDKKIPKDLRNEIPVITDAKDNIIWVYSIAKSNTINEIRENEIIYLVCEEII